MESTNKNIESIINESNTVNYKQLTIKDLQDVMLELDSKVKKSTQTFRPVFVPWFEAGLNEPIHLDWSNHLIESYFKNTSTRKFLKEIRNSNAYDEHCHRFWPKNIPNEHDIKELKIFLSLYNLKLIKPDWDSYYYVDYVD